MDHPISAIKDQVGSAQIILPQKQVNRNNDIYISMLGNDHEVTAKGIYAAIISTTVETDNPKKEVSTNLLGKTITRFDNIVDTWEPAADGTADNVYVTRSYDATSHFESISKEVLELYRRITGNELDLTPQEEQ
jgi:Rab GDP dissociation inhibitor